MMRENQIFRIYGTDFQSMTELLLERSELDAQIRKKGASLLSDRRNLRRFGPVRRAGDPEKMPDVYTDGKTDPYRPEDIRIAIKPNLVCPTPAEFGATTHPEIVAGILSYLQRHGFRNLEILEGSWVGDRTSEAYEYCGYRALCEKYGVPFLDGQKEKAHEVDADGMKLKILDVVDDIGFLINVPVLKGHCQTKITCALKNMKGLLPNAEKRHFHAMGLHRPIAHLSRVIHPDFIVIDHICGDLDFEEGGNPRTVNCVMTALDPVLTDSYVCALLGCTPDDVPYVRMAEALGSGSTDLSHAEVRTLTRNPDGTPGKEITENGSAAAEEEALPGQERLLSVSYAVEEVDSCSACYGNLIPALWRLREEGLLDALHTRIAIGQGQRGKTGELGVGACTRTFAHSIPGCPPSEKAIYAYLKAYLLDRSGK